MSSLPADRSAVALRSAGSVLICWVFGTMAAVNFKHVSHLMVPWLRRGWPLKSTEVALACVVSFATPMNLLGDTCRNAFIWASSITVLTPLGLGCCYLCFLIGGLQWNLWVLAVGLGATVLLGVLWSFSAAHLHSPRMMLAGNSATVVICILPLALVLGGQTDFKGSCEKYSTYKAKWGRVMDNRLRREILPAGPITADREIKQLQAQVRNLEQKDHVQLLVSLAGLVTAIFIGALLPLIISHLPYIGAAASASAVPRAAAKKLAALADLCEAVAIYPLPTAAALHRHRECRLRLLSSTQELNAACQSAKMELTEFDLFPEGLAEFQKQTEECRRSLQMKSTMLAAGFSSVTLDLFFRGTPGEQLRATSVWSAHALRSSGSYLLSLAGDQPPEACPGLPGRGVKASSKDIATST
ncbi:unnamed protein product [Cladocopium goreaui]|uniref:Aluminum-activated malate transporter 9 n=1 Tax=Cladocopium goreaui TaxID=2562237 RepID=A0A9P1BRJ0_9DINO|nr:unnamed protein product [Cladocopium goreaui]